MGGQYWLLQRECIEPFELELQQATTIIEKFSLLNIKVEYLRLMMPMGGEDQAGKDGRGLLNGERSIRPPAS